MRKCSTSPETANEKWNLKKQAVKRAAAAEETPPPPESYIRQLEEAARCRIQPSFLQIETLKEARSSSSICRRSRESAGDGARRRRREQVPAHGVQPEVRGGAGAQGEAALAQGCLRRGGLLRQGISPLTFTSNTVWGVNLLQR